jgi:hypothetical protein
MTTATTAPTAPTTPRTRVRGTVLLVVMLLLAVATAVAVSQFTVVSNEAVSSVRVEEELQARALAEGCLALVERYAQGYIGTSPPGFNFPDFDGLLDRDNTLHSADDHLPTFGTRVLIPRNLTPTTGATAAAHQWAFLARGAAPNVGGCLMRLEDNSDDGLPSVPSGTTSAIEGLGRDVPQRDRDRAITITVVGLFPVLATTSAEEAWERAHARVTLKKLFAAENPQEAPPALQACDDVTLSSNTAISGLGGVQGDSITVNGGSTCGCGQYTGNSVTPSTPPNACAAPCVAPSVAVAAPPACAAPPIPSATYYMDNKGFGDPFKNDNNIGDDDSCKVYIDRFGRVFVWDFTDTYANEPLDSTRGVPLTALAQYVRPLAGTALAHQTIPNFPVHDCTNYRTDPVELPCEWDTDGANTSDERVTCDFSNGNRKLRQTPCWKPIAHLGDLKLMTSDVTLGTATIPTLSGLKTNHTEMSSDENSEDLLFLKNKPIPNVRDQTKRFATGLASTTICGDPGGCEDCTGASNNDWWTECSSNASTVAKTRTCEDFHSHSHQNNRHIPWPIVFAWDVDPAAEINFEFEGAATKPLNATILTNGKVAFGAPVAFCCAECGDGDSCSQPTTSPGMTSKFIPPAACVAGNAQVPRPSFTVPPQVPGPVQFKPSGYGYAFKADGVCEIASDSTVVGDVECKALHLSGASCVIGNVLVTGSSTAVGCTNPNCPNVGACIDGTPQLVGGIYAQGSVCAPSNGTLKGDIFTKTNVYFSSNFVLNGRVFAEQDIILDSNAKVLFNDTTQIISAGNKGLTTFMETSW